MRTSVKIWLRILIVIWLLRPSRCVLNGENSVAVRVNKLGTGRVRRILFIRFLMDLICVSLN